MGRGVDPAVAPPDIANHMDVESLEQRSWRFETACGVMVKRRLVSLSEVESTLTLIFTR